MKKNYCTSCGKEIKISEVFMQSIMFGIYCDRCGEVSRASKKSKIIFLAMFIPVILLIIFAGDIREIGLVERIVMAIVWCIIGLWGLQPLVCDFN